MHDFLLAKEIIEKIIEVIKEKKLRKVSVVYLEVGSITMSHDGMPEHADEISTENLRFGLESLAKNTALEGAKFEIERVNGNEWKIKHMEAK